MVHQRATAAEHYVVRLDVVVHQTLLVRVSQGIDDLTQYLHRIGDRKLAMLCEALAQRLAFHVWHHVIEETIGNVCEVRIPWWDAKFVTGLVLAWRATEMTATDNR